MTVVLIISICIIKQRVSHQFKYINTHTFTFDIYGTHLKYSSFFFKNNYIYIFNNFYLLVSKLRKSKRFGGAAHDYQEVHYYIIIC